MFKSLNDNNIEMNNNNMAKTGSDCDENVSTSVQSKVNISNEMKTAYKSDNLEISFSSSNPNGKDYRGAGVDVMQDISIGQLPGLGSLGGLGSVPDMIPSRIAKKTTNAPVLLNEAKFDSEVNHEFIPASKVIKKNELIDTPQVYLEMTSILVNSDNADDVLNGLHNEILSYSNDVECNVDGLNYIINGLIIIMNTAVNFGITIFRENDSQLRIEFRRTSGDSIKYSEFYRGILAGFATKFDTDYDVPSQSTIFDMSLDYCLSLDDEPTNKYTFTNNELNNYCSVLANDTYTNDTLTELYNGCIQNDKIRESILNHNKLFNEILNKLTHKDIVCVRQSLLLLDTLMQYKSLPNIITNVSPLLTNKSDLIRIYAIKCLASINVAWNLSLNVSNKIENSIAKCQNYFASKTFATKDFITKQMFDTILANLK